MRSIGLGEILTITSSLSGHPREEFATDEVLLGLRVVTGSAFAVGQADGVIAGVRELARGLLACPPDEESAAHVAHRCVDLLLARNSGRLDADARSVILRFGEARRRRSALDEVLDWLVGRMVWEPAGSARPARQERRLFGPAALEPIEVSIGVAHPIAAVPADLWGKVMPKLLEALRGALRDAERELHGRLALRLEAPPEELPPDDTEVSDHELWLRVSGLMLQEVHGIVCVDLAGTAVSDGSTHLRLAHRAHAGPGLWIQDPGCRCRGRLGTAWAREVGWRVTQCSNPAKIRKIARRWIVTNADALEWSARTRSDLALLFSSLQRRLEQVWRRTDKNGRAAIRSAACLTDAEINRALTDVHFLDSLPGWQLDVLRVVSDAPPGAQAVAVRLPAPVNWESLLQAQDEHVLTAEVSRELRRHVQAQLADPEAAPLKRTYRQASDWLALKRELGL